MQRREFGNTGLMVSALGLGAGQIGEASVDDATAALVLNGALDLGVTLIDTARGYGLSEERIGRHLAHRRDEFVLSTKGGYDIQGTDDWTPANVRGSVERSLRLLQTDHVDVFHLHSCPAELLRRGELIDELDRLVGRGLIRVAAYSGENDALAWAVSSGRFGSVETSVNLADQWSLRQVLPGAEGMGVIAKRPLANAPWRFDERPVGHYALTYWDRLRVLGLDPGELGWDALALRFTAFAQGVDCAITGTASLHHLERNARLVEAGPLPAEVTEQIVSAWWAHGQAWPGEV